MDAKTLEALRGSIAKWEGIVAGEEVDDGGDNCPLCQIFNASTDRRDPACNGCPVRERTGMPFCSGSPYADAVDAEEDEGADSDEYRVAAQAELDFLKSLLPPDTAAVTNGDRS